MSCDPGRVKFRQRAWSLLSPQPPFGFFSLIFFLRVVLTNCKLKQINVRMSLSNISWNIPFRKKMLF